MPDETRLQFTADTTAFKEVERAQKAAFSPLAQQEFQRKSRELERDLQKLGREQAKLAEEMRKVDKGTEAYDKLRDTLKGVKDEYALIATAAQGYTRALKESADEAERVSRLQQFGAGAAQGAGVGEYIPAEAGMGYRIAGAMAGRGIRGAAAPFMMPGVGGMAQMLGGIPIAGAAAAGALTSAQGYFQQAVGYEQSQLGLLPYAGKTRRVGVTTETMPGGAGLEALSRAIPNEERYAETSGLEDARFQSLKMNQWAMEKEEAKRTGKPIPPKPFMTAKQADVAAARASRVTSYKEVAGPGKPSMGWGAGMGYAPMEEAGLVSGFFGARGGTFQGAAKGEMVEAAAAQRRYGVGVGLGGGYQRMFQPGAGGSGGEESSLSNAIAIALSQGLSGSQIPEFLSEIVEQGKQAERTGIKFDVKGTLLDPALLLSSAGLEGLQAGRVSAGFQRAARGVSERGVQSPTDVLMMRAAGFRGGGVEEYFQAGEKLEGGMDEGIMRELLTSMATSIQGIGYGGEATKRGLMRRGLGRMGIQVGSAQAGKFLESFGTGGGPIGMAQTMTQQELIQQARTGAQQISPLGVRAAGVQSEQIGAGRGLAKTMINLDNAQRQTVLTLGNFDKALEMASSSVLKLTKWVDKATKPEIVGVSR